MKEIVFPEHLFTYLQQNLLRASEFVESAAVLFMCLSTSKRRTRYLVREVIIVPPDVYDDRTMTSLQINSTFIAQMTQRASKENLVIGFVHTHPGETKDSKPRFSIVDDKGEARLASFLLRRTGTDQHISMVMSRGGTACRLLGTREYLRVVRVGKKIQVTIDQDSTLLDNEYFDRQVRFFGKVGQERLGKLHIGIVGLGGTGSLITQSLSYLGLQTFTLIDPDHVSVTNLNRLVGASLCDVNKPKVETASQMIRLLHPNAWIEAIQGDVTETEVSNKLLDVDFIFCCTDSHGSRSVINQIAYQYLIPVIDMGVSITAKQGNVEKITGRVQMLSPGLGCLVCGKLLNYDQVRWDFMEASQRAADPYFIGEGERTPSVISLNSTATSLAISMFMGAVLGVPMDARLQIYDGIKGSVRSAQIQPVGGCVICSSSGMLARGDSVRLPGRGTSN
jgi:hypothetical protein